MPSKKKKLVTPTKKPRIKRGDTIVVIAGSDKGKTGLVKLVDKHRSQVLVESINMVKKSVSSQYSTEGFVSIEKPLSLSNVMYFDASEKKATRLGFSKEDGKKSRLNKLTKQTIQED